MAPTISYFDCNVSIGAPKQGVYRPCTTVEELIAEMDWVGVDRALVHHTLMRDQSPVVGNRVLVETIRKQPPKRCLMQWTDCGERAAWQNRLTYKCKC